MVLCSMKNQPSKFAIFTYGYLLVAFLCICVFALLPTGGRDPGVEFCVYGLLFLGLVILIPWSFVQSFREFKTRGFASGIPFFMVGVSVLFLPQIYELPQTLKFFVAQNMYQEVADLAIQGRLKDAHPADSGFDDVIVTSRYWYIGGGKPERINLVLFSDPKLMFFKESSSLFGSYGFLYSSDNTYPERFWRGRLQEIRLDLQFKQIAKNWSYGSIRYND
jgi:hypothetical protein